MEESGLRIAIEAIGDILNLDGIEITNIKLYPNPTK